MGAIFAPLATMGMRAAPQALAGAASGVLNTGRQLGATLGGAITGAVLASQLAADLHTRARTAASLLPAAARGHLIHDVFARAYIAAMRPALAIPAALLIAGALACLLLRRDPVPGPVPQPGPSAQAAETLPDAAPAPAIARESE